MRRRDRPVALPQINRAYDFELERSDVVPLLRNSRAIRAGHRSGIDRVILSLRRSIRSFAAFVKPRVEAYIDSIYEEEDWAIWSLAIGTVVLGFIATGMLDFVLAFVRGEIHV